MSDNHIQNGCEMMGCDEYIDGKCHHEGPCKYREYDLQLLEESDWLKARIKELEAENARIKADYADRIDQALVEIGELEAENAEFKAEVERLGVTKAEYSERADVLNVDFEEAETGLPVGKISLAAWVRKTGAGKLLCVTVIDFKRQTLQQLENKGIT